VPEKIPLYWFIGPSVGDLVKKIPKVNGRAIRNILTGNHKRGVFIILFMGSTKGSVIIGQ